MGIKKSIFLLAAISMCAVPQAFAKVLTLNFNGFLSDATCAAISITTPMASNIQVKIETSKIKDKATGVPTIVGISGVVVEGKPAFTQRGLHGLYGYISGESSISFNASNDPYVMQYIIIQSAHKDGPYTGYLNVAGTGAAACMIHLQQN